MVSRGGRTSLWVATALLLLAAAGGIKVLRSGPAPQLVPRRLPLQKAKPQRDTIEAHAEHRYALALAQRECAFGSLKPWTGVGSTPQPASDLLLSVREPELAASDRDSKASRLLRTFKLRKAGIDFELCAEAEGSYELAVSAGETAGGYELSLERVLPRGIAKRNKVEPAPAQKNLSPKLRALASELRDPAKLERFWSETRRAGTPLIEPTEADASWVTFLYRGSALTKQVSISWQLWAGELAQTQLALLPGTDVWWRSLRLPNAARASYQLTIDPPDVDGSDPELAERAQAAVTQADPLNRHPMFSEAALDPFAQRSVLQLPAAAPERWLQPESKPTPGRLERQSLHSQKLGHEHALTVYLPAGYDEEPERVYPLVIFFDGEDYLRDIAAPRLLDALIAARAITPLVALFVHNDDPNQRAEELPCNALFAMFVTQELLPFAHAHYRLASEAAQTGLAGSSFGGLASSFIALTYPDQFGKVLSQSGSYWWSFPADHAAYDGSEKPGWLRRRFAERPVARTQFYLSAGIFEASPEGDGVLEQNRLQRDGLRALGYSVAYQEFVGGHDHLAWRATLPDGLIALYAPAP